MKIISRIFILGVAVLLVSPVYSQNNGILKIGVVDINRLLGESPQFQEARAKLEDEFVPRQREIVTREAALAEKAATFEKDMPVMGEPEREAAQRELRNDERALARAQNEFREDAQMRENEMMRGIQQDIGREVVGYGQAEGYDIILPAGGAGVIFASPRVDITDSLISRLQTSYKSDGG
jgi:outer membrane protein